MPRQANGERASALPHRAVVAATQIAIPSTIRRIGRSLLALTLQPRHLWRVPTGMNTITKTLTAATALALLAAPGAAQAAPPTPHQLSISAKPASVVYGKPVSITGQ